MQEIKLNHYQSYLKPRQPNSHKGDYGHVLIIGGEAGYNGAVRLAGEAALRAGAGLVSIATRKEHAGFLNATCPELMCHGVEQAKQLENLIAKATVIAVGPGISQSRWAEELIEMVFATGKSLVVDADALNYLAEHPRKQSNWILTPHPGEAARLLKTTAAAIQSDRPAAIKKIADQFGGVCVLKGAGTLIATDHAEPVICKAGNPGMATAGMGDVLTGVIAALLAEQVPLVPAAELGVLVHALAGDSAAKKGQRGMKASDLMKYIRHWVNV